jgi:hypothetical protein
MNDYCERCGCEGSLRMFTDKGNGDRYPLCPKCYKIKKEG